jgi:hypothetical protein
MTGLVAAGAGTRLGGHEWECTVQASRVPTLRVRVVPRVSTAEPRVPSSEG